LCARFGDHRHCFQKKDEKTSKADTDLARKRDDMLLEELRR